MMIQRAVLSAVLAGAFGVASADEPVVADIARITGKSLVNQGEADVPGREGMPLRSGFRVMALEGGVVIVQYRDGCRYKVEDDDLHVVGDVSPCEAGYIPSDAGQAPLLGGASLEWIPPAAFVGVGVLGAVFDTGSDRRPSISPDL